MHLDEPESSAATMPDMPVEELSSQHHTSYLASLLQVAPGIAFQDGVMKSMCMSATPGRLCTAWIVSKWVPTSSETEVEKVSEHGSFGKSYSLG